MNSISKWIFSAKINIPKNIPAKKTWTYQQFCKWALFVKNHLSAFTLPCFRSYTSQVKKESLTEVALAQIKPTAIF